MSLFYMLLFYTDTWGRVDSCMWAVWRRYIWVQQTYEDCTPRLWRLVTLIK